MVFSSSYGRSGLQICQSGRVEPTHNDPVWDLLANLTTSRDIRTLSKAQYTIQTIWPKSWLFVDLTEADEEARGQALVQNFSEGVPMCCYGSLSESSR